MHRDKRVTQLLQWKVEMKSLLCFITGFVLGLIFSDDSRLEL